MINNLFFFAIIILGDDNMNYEYHNQNKPKFHLDRIILFTIIFIICFPAISFVTKSVYHLVANTEAKERKMYNAQARSNAEEYLKKKYNKDFETLQVITQDNSGELSGRTSLKVDFDETSAVSFRDESDNVYVVYSVPNRVKSIEGCEDNYQRELMKEYFSKNIAKVFGYEENILKIESSNSIFYLDEICDENTKECIFNRDIEGASIYYSGVDDSIFNDFENKVKTQKYKSFIVYICEENQKEDCIKKKLSPFNHEQNEKYLKNNFGPLKKVYVYSKKYGFKLYEK